MGAFVGALFIYAAILMHGCDVKQAAEIEAKAIRERNCK